MYTEHLERLLNRYPALARCKPEISKACGLLVDCFGRDNRLYICGNGGSAADALHIVGELTKAFVLDRPLDDQFVRNAAETNLSANLQGALPAFALVENAAFATAYINDCTADYVFAQQVYAYARKGDCVWGISTSGNSKNVVLACKTAKARGASTIALTGASGGELKELCDICICVPESETHKIQELHLPVYHAICLILEEYFWGKK